MLRFKRLTLHFYVVVIFCLCSVFCDDNKGLFCTNGNCTTDSNVTMENDITTRKSTEGITLNTINTSTNEDVRPTTSTISETSSSQDPLTVVPLKPEGRAINFTLEEHGSGNILTSNVSSSETSNKFLPTPTPKLKDLSDVSMDDDDVDTVQLITTEHPKGSTEKLVNKTCLDNGKTFMVGEKYQKGCDESCICRENGTFDCKPRCSAPYFRKGRQLNDPLCTERDVDDECCALLVCADTETEPLEMCSYQNKTYQRGEKFNEGCLNVCSCEHSGKVQCKPRCPPLANKTSVDQCVTVPDPQDSCCSVVLCDVSLDEHDNKDISVSSLVSAEAFNSSTIKLSIESSSPNATLDHVEISEDKQVWRMQKISPNNLLIGLSPGRRYFLKTGESGKVIEVKLPKEDLNEIKNDNLPAKDGVCVYKGANYSIGQEFDDNCEKYCVCTKKGVTCAKVECPTNFGLDVLDSSCLEWETVPPNFVPKPPICCPEKVVCKNNGSCDHEGIRYHNFAEIPTNITGCHKHCYCEFGKIECQEACPPVTAQPPASLPCPPHHAVLRHTPEDDCCLFWMCGVNEGNDSKHGSQTELDRPETTLNQSTNGFLLPTPLPVPDDTNNTKESIQESTPLPFYPKPSSSKVKPPKTDSTSYDTKEHSFLGPYATPSSVPPITKTKSNSKNKQNEKSEKPISNFNVPDLNDVTNVNSDTTPFQYQGPLAPNYQENSKSPSFETSKNNWGSGPIMKNPDTSKKNFKTQQKNPPTGPVINNQNAPGPGYFNPLTSKTKPIINDDYPPLYQNHFPSDSIKSSKPVQPDSISPEELLHLLHQQHPDIINSAPPGTVFKVSVPVDSSQTKLSQKNPNQYQNQQFVHPEHGFGQFIQQANNLPLPPGLHGDTILQHIQKDKLNPGSPQFNNNYPESYVPQGQEHLFIPPHLQHSLLPAQSQINLTHATAGFTPGFPVHPAFGQQNDEITVVDLEAINENTVRLVFTVPPVMVGLHGRVELRYTDKKSDDPATWELQVFAPPNDLIATPQLEFELGNLRPDTEYRIKITVILRDLHNTPSSRIYTVRTLPVQLQTTLPPVIPIEPSLSVRDVNSTWITVVWRKFTDHELQFIDGVQLRYKEINGMVYAATPLIHRAVTSYTLENLKPNTEYEVGIYFIPFPGQQTELKSEKMLYVTTTQDIDMYGFNVTLEIKQIKSTSVEVTWSGVPYPEDKFVNIYRAIYQSQFGKEDFSTFKIAKRDSPAKTVIHELKPSTKYRLWLEVYLTNGKIKASNVQDFMTKDGIPPPLEAAATKQGKLEREVTDVRDHRGDYYGPLVVVAILAALAVLSTLILLLILMRRHGQNKAAISSPVRVSQASYDNPTYKVEIQQETMNL